MNASLVRVKAKMLAEARVRYAEEFLRAKAMNPGITDKHAMFIADEVTKAELVRLEAELYIAKEAAPCP